MRGLGVDTGAGHLDSREAWAPSPAMKLGNSLPLWPPGRTLDVRPVFQASGGGSWAVDDVYIDPYRRQERGGARQGACRAPHSPEWIAP